MTRAARAALLAVSTCLAAAVHAQTLSPGKLGKSHSEFEGLSNCTKCHELGKKEVGPRCLDCHEALKHRVDRKTGMHGRLASEGRDCQECHKDHRGEDAALTDWGGPRDKFDHKKTGWPLEGKHAQAECKACHDAKVVDDPELKKRFGPGRHGTFLGVGRKCTECHFDEHRGQLGTDCTKCHDQRRFKPAPKFDHADYFRLKGAHVRAECTGCHQKTPDKAFYPEFPRPADPARFIKYKGASKNCADCHKDPHAGQFGVDCARCHNERDWHGTRNVTHAAPTFHDRSRFPLEGRHREVACDRCHPSKPRGGLVLRGFPFKECVDCHVDAHLGQISRPGETPRCERCHDEEGFSPTSFPLGDHQKSRYPLLAAHRAVACNACHLPDPAGLADRVPPALRGRDKPEKRTQVINFTRILFPDKDLNRCESCHADVHRGQFRDTAPARTCTDCHDGEDFRRTRFDHDRDSRFPLTGKHRGVACSLCHAPPAADGESTVYRGTATRCDACHRDPHAGQFRASAAGGACERCHAVTGFQPSRFTHADPSMSDFELRGRHATVACASCHPGRATPQGTVAWYRGVPRRCDACHQNIHEGLP